ncbi:MAG TPA: cupredoxin domain-containing protein [Cellvibrio sp.]|nr:cupredoxin domain-containing protein [Cellvibrio sp.]
MKWSLGKYSWFLLFLASNVCAIDACPTFTIAITKNIVDPDILVVPANTKIKLIILNNDQTPEEFESRPLKVKKIIMGKTQVIVFIGPLPAGDYTFTGAYHPRSTGGVVRATSPVEVKK